MTHDIQLPAGNTTNQWQSNPTDDTVSLRWHENESNDWQCNPAHHGIWLTTRLRNPASTWIQLTPPNMEHAHCRATWFTTTIWTLPRLWIRSCICERGRDCMFTYALFPYETNPLMPSVTDHWPRHSHKHACKIENLRNDCPYLEKRPCNVTLRSCQSHLRLVAFYYVKTVHAPPTCWTMLLY